MICRGLKWGGILLVALVRVALAGPECTLGGNPIYKPKNAEEALQLFRACGAEWSKAQKKHLLDNFKKNSDGTYSGAIIASPSEGRKQVGKPGDKNYDPGEPDYRFHWIRDSAIAVQALAGAYKLNDSTPEEQKDYLAAMTAYIDFSKQVQELPLSHDFLYFDHNGVPQYYIERDGKRINVPADYPGAIGVRYSEPKVRVIEKTVTNPDGSKKTVWVPGDFNEGWGRPQNDGPPLRIIAIAKVLPILEQERAKFTSGGKKVPAELDATIAKAVQVMKEDFALIQSRWGDPSFDIWEEVLAEHFFTRSVMSEAIEKGIPALKRAAATSGLKVDGLDEAGLRDVHDRIEGSLREFFNGSYIRAFRNEKFPSGRATDKDMAVIMAALRRRPNKNGKDPLGNFSASDPRVLATAVDMIREFKSDPKFADPPGVDKPAVPIGRYPKDRWNGRERIHDNIRDSKGQEVTPGNPWPITTLAMDELFLKAALEFHEAGEVRINGLNRAFFEYIYGGASELPAEWRRQLDAGRDVHLRLTGNPKLEGELLERMLRRGTEFAARILDSGISPYEAAPEQTLHENALGDLMKAIQEIGARKLTWNAAQYLRTRKCFLLLRDLRHGLR